MIDPNTVPVENKSQLGAPLPSGGGAGGKDHAYLGARELKILRAAVEAGTWNVTAEDREKVLALCRSYVGGGGTDDVRAQIRAAELLAAVQRDNLRTLEVLDKIHRLDSELPTEITHGVQVVVQEVDPTLNRPE